MPVYTSEEAREMILSGNAPRDMIVGRSFYLLGRTALTALPDGLEVRGNLKLVGCTALKELPYGLKVDGWLNLTDCTALTELPDDLIFNGSLNLRGCISLTHLPKGLKVGGDLHLNDCTSLKALPDGLNVGNYIYLNHPLSIPDTVSCEGFTFRDVEDFPREYINDPSSITDAVIQAQTNTEIQAMLIELMPN
jgi:hypothetical protein